MPCRLVESISRRLTVIDVCSNWQRSEMLQWRQRKIERWWDLFWGEQKVTRPSATSSVAHPADLTHGTQGSWQPQQAQNIQPLLSSSITDVPTVYRSTVSSVLNLGHRFDPIASSAGALEQ